MAGNTKIQWCDKTASPWHGCSKVAAGCLNCYAERQSLRNQGTLGVWGDNGTRIKSKSFISNLRKWNKQAEADGVSVKVFPSICDPFEDRPELVDWRNEMFAVADECPWVILLLLTKRPENVRRMWPNKSCEKYSGGKCVDIRTRNNCWIGTSISTQADADRNIPHLLQCRDLSPVLFVSAEPLVEPVNLLNFIKHPEMPDHIVKPYSVPVEYIRVVGIDWLIIGGESGPHARRCEVRWVRTPKEQCQASGVPVFIKQLGANVMIPDDPHGESTGLKCLKTTDGRWRAILRDPKGGDPSEWPDDLRVREMPVMKQGAAS